MRENKSETLRNRIITTLRENEDWRSEGGSAWRSFKALAEELGEPERCVKREVRRLARAGVLFYSQLFNDEGRLNGGGYILKPSWDDHRPGREGDPPPSYGDIYEEVIEANL